MPINHFELLGGTPKVVTITAERAVAQMRDAIALCDCSGKDQLRGDLLNLENEIATEIPDQLIEVRLINGEANMFEILRSIDAIKNTSSLIKADIMAVNHQLLKMSLGD